VPGALSRVVTTRELNVRACTGSRIEAASRVGLESITPVGVLLLACIAKERVITGGVVVAVGVFEALTPVAVLLLPLVLTERQGATPWLVTPFVL